MLLGGFGWALGNLASRKAAAPKPLHLTMWMSVVPPIPMFALSLLVEGPGRIGAAMTTSLSAQALPAWAGLAYTVLLGTLLGSGLWVWLMARHPAGVVAPFSLLVPVVGITAAWLLLGEQPMPLELLGGVLVVGGVVWASVVPRPRIVAEPAPIAEADSDVEAESDAESEAEPVGRGAGRDRN